ncbi:MAG: hypoxanthine phosphoribosyltransferase [Filifactoraceae bacterium]
MDLNITGVLFSEDKIKKRIEELAKEIEDDFKGEDIFVIGVLKGSFVFVSDLIRKFKSNIELDFMSLSSYGMSTTSSGVVKITKDLDLSINGKNVLVVEDIIDTGLTMDYLSQYLVNKGCKKVKICTLLDKPSKRKSKVAADYVGFSIDDLFVVGYGIDCKEMYRNLPYIGYVEV